MYKSLTALLFFIIILALFPFVPTEAADKEEKGPLSKITFIHYKKDNARVTPKPVVKPKTSTCYDFLASGAKWKHVEDYYVNPAFSQLTGSEVQSAINAAVDEWHYYSPFDMFGSLILTDYNNIAYDYKNLITFSPLDDNNIIAVTSVWGYFGGAPKTRELVEWDMQFNTYYDWGDASVQSSKMDLVNIATHELGHSAGLNDLYNTVCVEETMYGYSREGDISKRSLNFGDIQGINALYK